MDGVERTAVDAYAHEWAIGLIGLIGLIGFYRLMNSLIAARVSAMAVSRSSLMITLSNLGAKLSSYSARAMRCSMTSGASVARPTRRARSASMLGGWMKMLMARLP